MVQAVTSPPDKQIQYGYDSVGRRIQMVDPDGGRFTYGYDEAGRLDHLINPQDERTTYTFDAVGHTTEMELANGTRAIYTYDALGQLTWLDNVKSDDTVISSFDYSYDNVGNRTGVVEAGGDRVTWIYDDTYQLTREERTGTSAYDVTHRYDPLGNRLVKIDAAAGRTTSTYDAANQLSTSEDGVGTTTYTYDAAGNLELSVDPAADRTTNTWDGTNRRTLVEMPGDNRVTMLYNAEGLRVRKETDAETRNFIWDDQSYLVETDENDASQMVYTNRPGGFGKLISQRRNTGGAWSVDYFHFDGLGSTANITDIAEQVPETYIYNAFGTRVSSNIFLPDFLWIGQLGYYYDSELIDYYIRARHYDPGLARWLSQDPIGYRGGINLYMYVGGNPIRRTDASGLTWGINNVPGGSPGVLPAPWDPPTVPTIGGLPLPPSASDLGLPPPPPNWAGWEPTPPGSSSATWPGFYGGAEAQLPILPPIGVGGGIQAVRCKDANGCWHKFIYTKVCGGVGGIANVGVGIITGFSGANCNPDNYEGWFLEGSLGAGLGVSGAIGIADGWGILPVGGFTGVNTLGLDAGAGAQLSLCYYVFMYEE